MPDGEGRLVVDTVILGAVGDGQAPETATSAAADTAAHDTAAHDSAAHDTGTDAGVPPFSRRDVARVAARQPKVPWLWIAAGVVTLALAGRGALGISGGTDGRAETTASGSVGPVPTTTASAEPSGTAPSVGPTATAGAEVPITVPSITRVTHARLPTATDTPSGSVTPTTSPASPLACSASAGLSQGWWDGYNADITVRNTGTAVVSGWRITFSLPPGQEIVNSWNATVSQSGQQVTASDAGWNSQIAPGASASIGVSVVVRVHFEPGPARGPSGFALNGVACS